MTDLPHTHLIEAKVYNLYHTARRGRKNWRENKIESCPDEDTVFESLFKSSTPEARFMKTRYQTENMDLTFLGLWP